jgi:hypothetical protein
MQRKTARIAGAIYLLSAVTAGAPLIYVSSRLIVPDDAAKTAGNGSWPRQEHVSAERTIANLFSSDSWRSIFIQLVTDWI